MKPSPLPSDPQFQIVPGGVVGEPRDPQREPRGTTARDRGDQVLRLLDVADLLNYSKRTITRMEKAGTFPARLQGYGRPRYRRSDVDAWRLGLWQVPQQRIRFFTKARKFSQHVR